MNLPTMPPNRPRSLILGSTSIYRRELLSRLRVPFDVVSPEVDETPQPGEVPRALAERLALAKANAVADKFAKSVVIGSDQVADLNGESLGKPGSHPNAVLQLRLMRGQTVWFHTAVAVVCKEAGFEQHDVVTTKVRFREFSDDEIENYLELEKPYDCAGSAKSEGLGISMLDSIESGDPTALIGLPLIKTCQMIRQAGVVLLAKSAEAPA